MLFSPQIITQPTIIHFATYTVIDCTEHIRNKPELFMMVARN